MSFEIINPQHKKVEEEALFAFARQISLDKAKVKRGQEAVEKYLFPIFKSRQVHSDLHANCIALCILGEYLDPTNGSFRFLPQCSPQWLAFRRLFLSICDQEIPKDMQAEGFMSHWDTFPKREKQEFLKTHGLIDEEEREEQPSIWESMYASDLHVTKRVTEIRMQNYAGISLAKMKRSLAEAGKIEIDAECGALYEIAQNLLRDQIPESLTLPPSRPVKTTLDLLKGLVDEAGGSIGIDIDVQYKKAARSVREVFFDIATEATIGEVTDPSISAWEMEQLFCERRLIEDPYSILSDDRILFFVADGIAEGASFLKRVASMMETADKWGYRLKHDPVKVALATYWLNPQFPLWLMRTSAILTFLDMIGIKPGEKLSLEYTVDEFFKEREASSKSGLFRATKKLITEINYNKKEGLISDMTFPKYVQEAKLFHKLEEHASNLSVSDLSPQRDAEE